MNGYHCGNINSWKGYHGKIFLCLTLTHTIPPIKQEGHDGPQSLT